MSRYIVDSLLYDVRDSLHIRDRSVDNIFSILAHGYRLFVTQITIFEGIETRTNTMRSEIESDKTTIFVNVCYAKSHKTP